MRQIPYGKHFIDQKDIDEVILTLKSDFITQGQKIGEFEHELAEYCGSKYAVVFNSGTSALHGSYFALGISEGDEVITSPITFAATSNAALYLNSKPVFVDIERKNGNLDYSKVQDKITEQTKIIVPVHYGGNPVDLEELHQLAKDYDLKIVEDAAHAIGSKYHKEPIGNCKYSEMTIFSFHPVKHITTGEGGAVLTNNKTYYEKLLAFRSHGITKENLNAPNGDWYYEMQSLGYNYRMTEIQASLGISQLKKVDKFIKARRKIAKLYNETFHDSKFFDIIYEKENCISSYHLYPILLKQEFKSQKKYIFSKLRENGLGVQVHYIPVYLHPYYQKLGYKSGLCPIAEDFYHREISIPLFPSMKEKDEDYVIKTILDVFKSIEETV